MNGHSRDDEPRDRRGPADESTSLDDLERDRTRRRTRKEHVLHTRISENLADDIRRMADDLRVPVSNLVRNVLEEAFSVVETVSDNVGGLIEEVMDEAERARGRVRRRHRRRHRRRGSGRARTHRHDGGPGRDEDLRDARRRDDEDLRDARRRDDPDLRDARRRDDPDLRDARAERAEFAEVLGWQPLVLHREQRCADCEESLERGERAFAALGDAGPTGAFLCDDCMDARR